MASAEPGTPTTSSTASPSSTTCSIKPVTPTRLRLRLDRALDTINSRRVIEQLDDALVRKSQELHELNNIGVALSAQRDIDKLLELILLKCREITAADAGSLYLVERAKERDPSSGRPAPLQAARRTTPCRGAVREAGVSRSTRLRSPATSPSPGRSSTSPTPITCPPGSPFKVSAPFDEKSGYRTKSMLVVPMRDHQDKVIGVIQLINKKRDAQVGAAARCRSWTRRSSPSPRWTRSW